MQKPAITPYKILSSIRKRWSPRAFSEKAVSTEQLQRIFAAGQWAPSTFNEQPWRFIIGIKGEGDNWEKVYNSLNEWNQKWAQSAPVLVLICGKKVFTRNGRAHHNFKYDVGQAAAYVSIQLSEEGLFAHQMGGILPDEARKIFNIPEEFEALTGMAIGYAGALDRIPEAYHEGEKEQRSRKALQEIVFTGEWGNPHEEIKD